MSTMDPETCDNTPNLSNRKSRYQKRKLEFLNYIRDSLERRLAAIDASITTLEKQIARTNI